MVDPTRRPWPRPSGRPGKRTRGPALRRGRHGENLPFPDNSVELWSAALDLLLEDPVKGSKRSIACCARRKAYIGGGAGSGYPEPAVRKLIQQRQEKMKSDEPRSGSDSSRSAAPSKCTVGQHAKLPDYQVMAKARFQPKTKGRTGSVAADPEEGRPSDSPPIASRSWCGGKWSARGSPAVAGGGPGRQVVLASGFGLADVERNVRATAETVYQIQSLTKSFTATDHDARGARQGRAGR